MRPGMGLGRSNFAAAAVAGLLLLLLFLNSAYAQQSTPFLGQGYPPMYTNTTVYTSAIVDRLIAIDDQNYRFEVVLFMMFTWEDPRARQAMLQSTAAAGNMSYDEAATIFFSPDTASAALWNVTTPHPTSDYTCSLPCSSLYAFVPGRSMCCDGMWLPQLEFVNVRGMSQDRMVRYGIRFPAANATNANAVAWWAHVQMEAYTPLSFRSFPFDKQLLVVQVDYGERNTVTNVTFVQSTTGLSLYTPTSGDDLSGWSVESLEIIPFKYPNDDLAVAKTAESNQFDPWPIHPHNLATNNSKFVGSLWHQGFNIIITVNRITLWYMITGVVPIMLNVLLSLLVFAVSPKHLDTRLGIVVTLFLALTALLYVVAGNLPASSTVVSTQQLCVLGYMILGLIGLESIIVYRITTIERQKQLKLRTKVARKQFINRWDSLLARVKSKAMSQSAVGQDGPSSAPSLTTPQKRWKAAVQNATDSSTQGQKDLVANGGSRERDRGQPSTSQEKKDRKKDESDQVYGGAMGVYMPGLDSTSDSEPYGGASDGSSFASTPRMEREKSAALALQKEQAQAAAVPKKASTAAKGMEGAAASAPGTVSASEMAASPFAGVSNDEEAALSAGCFKLRRRKKKAPPPQPGEELPLPPQPNWFQVQWAKLREMRREVSRNQDYALHIAMRIDFGCAVITGLGYIIALVLILAVQSSYQVNESYVTYKNLSNATSSS